MFGAFGGATAPNTPKPGAAFGGNIFGAPAAGANPAQAGGGGIFGTPTQTPNTNIFGTQTKPATAGLFGAQQTPAPGIFKTPAVNAFGTPQIAFGGDTVGGQQGKNPLTPMLAQPPINQQHQVTQRIVWKYDDCKNCPPGAPENLAIYGGQYCRRTCALIDLNTVQVIYGQGTRFCGYQHQPPQAPYWITQPIKHTDPEEGQQVRRFQEVVFDVLYKREDAKGLVRWTFNCSVKDFEAKVDGKSRRDRVIDIMSKELKFGNDTTIIDQPAIASYQNPNEIAFVFEVRYKGGPHPRENYEAYKADSVVQHIKSLGPMCPAWAQLKQLGIVMKTSGGNAANNLQSPTKSYGMFATTVPSTQAVQELHPKTEVVWTETKIQDAQSRDAPPGLNREFWNEIQNKAKALSKEDKLGKVYVPKVIRGFKGLKQRVLIQEQEIEKQNQQLEALTHKLEAIRTQQHILDMDIKAITDENSKLTQEILSLLAEPRRVHQFFDSAKDQELRARIEGMERDLSDPRHALGQLQDLIAKHHLQDTTEDLSIAQSLVPQPPNPVIKEFTQHLKAQQAGIKRMVDVIGEDEAVLATIDARSI